MKGFNLFTNIYLVPGVDLQGCVFDAVEVHPCHVVGQHGERQDVEICDDESAHFYGVYLHLSEGGITCVADCPDLELAEQMARLLEATGKQFYRNPEDDEM